MTNELKSQSNTKQTDTDAALPPASTSSGSLDMQIRIPNAARQAANALEAIAGHPLEATTIDALNAAHAGLLDTSTTGLMPSPARLLGLIEIMTIDLISAAASTTNPGAKSELMRTALAASKEVRELVGLLRMLKAEARGVEGRGVGAVIPVGVGAG